MEGRLSLFEPLSRQLTSKALVEQLTRSPSKRFPVKRRAQV